MVSWQPQILSPWKISKNYPFVKKMSESNSNNGDYKENISEKVFQKGNEHYTGGDLKKAEMAYSRALLYSPTDALRCTIVSNRCAVRVKLGNFMEAKHDAEEAVRLNPCWGKAHFRLGNVFLCLKDLEKAWIHLRRSVELDSSNTFFRDKIDKLEERMEEEGMSEKLKDLKKCVSNSSAVQFLPNIDLLSTNLAKSGSVRIGDGGFLWKKKFVEVTQKGSVYLSSDSLGRDRKESIKLMPWSEVRNSSKHSRTIKITGIRELPHKLKIKLDTQNDFIKWMKALKQVVSVSSQEKGDEHAKLRESFEDEAQKLAVRYTKTIEELQKRLSVYEGGLESKEQAKISSSLSSQDGKHLLKRVTELETKLKSSMKENNELRQTNVELKGKVSSLEAKLEGFEKGSSTSSSSSSSPSSALRQIFNKIDTEKKGSLTMAQTIEMVHTLDLNLKEKDMLDVVSDGESSSNVSYEQFEKMVKLSGKTISELQRTMQNASFKEEKDDEKSKKIIFNNKSRRELNSKELKTVKEVFARYDKNNSGTISSQAASSAIDELGMKPTDEELSTMVLAANVGENRMFGFKNFVQMICAVDRPIRLSSGTKDEFSEIECDDFRKPTDDERAEAKNLFDKFDIDKSGSIDSQELVGLMSHLKIFPTSDELSKMIELADTDNNGELDFEELVFLLSIAPKSENWSEVNGDDSDKACFKHKRTGRVVWNRLQNVTKDKLKKNCPWGPW